ALHERALHQVQAVLPARRVADALAAVRAVALLRLAHGHVVPAGARRRRLRDAVAERGVLLQDRLLAVVGPDARLAAQRRADAVAQGDVVLDAGLGLADGVLAVAAP